MATVLTQQRVERTETLKHKLWEALIKDDGGVYLAQTGSLLRGRNLRRKENKQIFRTILSAFPVPENETSRFWTKRLLSDSIRALVRDYKLTLPVLPGFNFEDWLKDQAFLFQSLAKKARRNSGPPSSSRSLSMDNVQTLPYNPEDREMS
jgi:hypothetical protein